MLHKLAPEMVKTASEIVGHDIIITDQHGIIIGSCEAERIGTLHEASLQVIKSRRQESHDLKSAKSLKGVKPGTTLPIELAGQIIGTVAIAGDPEEVTKYGMLVKSQVEILLKERMLIETNVLREIALQKLIHEISIFDSKYTDDFHLLTRGHELGYNLKNPHLALVADLKFQNPSISKLLKQNKFNSETVLKINQLKSDILLIFSKIFNNPQHIITFINNQTIVVLFSINYTSTEQEVIQLLKKKCTALIKLLEQNQVTAVIGLGRIAKNLSDLSQSYADAWQAVNLCYKLRLNPNIAYVADLSLQKLLLSIPPKESNDFCLAALDTLRVQNDWADLKKTIIAWCESCFNLTKTACELKVHRHTVLYRLNKIEQLTGFNMRNSFLDILKCYLAITLKDLNES